TLSDFPEMPVVALNWDTIIGNSLLAQFLDVDVDQERQTAELLINGLNSDQRTAYDKVLSSIDEYRGQTFFLNGAGGCGKTYLYKALIHHIRGRHQIVLCVASSGIAALLLPNGRTAHSMFKIPIDGLDLDSRCTIPKESNLAALIRAAIVIV
ncbi:hypothetical protein BDN72DRAFT_745984, partial [Pluteus cervinus]